MFVSPPGLVPTVRVEERRMRISSVITGACTVAVTIATGLSTAAVAGADDPSTWGINGTYEASSNGQWAKTNDRFQNEAVVRSRWTISTTCSTAVDCVGTVTSSQGWTAPIYREGGAWYVKRTVAGWEPCPDGTAADGLQIFRIYPVNTADGEVSLTDTSILTGEDVTMGPSGACGINKTLDIRMPFTAVKVS
jgi:hypothetical protein